MLARWEKPWTWSAEKVWCCRVRFVGQEYRWLEDRADLFAPAAGGDTSRLHDAVAMRQRWPTAAADAVNAFYRTLELGNGLRATTTA